MAKFREKYLSWSLFFNKETPILVFSCGFFEISNDTFFYFILMVAASERSKLI